MTHYTKKQKKITKNNKLIKNKNFRNNQNYIIGKEKYLITKNKNILGLYTIISFFIISPLILIFLGLIILIIKEKMKLNTYGLEYFGTFGNILIFIIWFILSNKTYKLLSSIKKNYILLKLNIKEKINRKNPNYYYYNNFIIIKKNEK